MNKTIVIGAAALVAMTGIALAEPVYDWGELRLAHENIRAAIQNIGDVQRANKGQFGGHAARAKQLLRDAEEELHRAVEYRKHQY
jgi:hypothetical protein